VPPTDETAFRQTGTPRSLADLRLRAEELARRSKDADLLDLVDELREDVALWPHLWAPTCALAAARMGRDDAFGFLEEAVTGGFAQPELFQGRLEDLLGQHPGWAELQRAMASGPPPSLELLDWPAPTSHHPLHLDALTEERENLLRVELPRAAPTSWETATTLLRWVHRRWAHANDHVDDPDAVEVLRRVDAGERFACVEYSIVLSQSLNALGIPARRVQLLQRNHHVGVGRAHVVSEAWVDDLSAWVLLDGQNGAYWADDNGRPLGLLELQQLFAAGAPRPSLVALDEELPAADADTWWTYFAGAKTTGYAWGTSFSPVFQNMAVITADRLLHDPRGAYPDLDTIAVGLGGELEHPMLRLATTHPYAIAFLVTGEGVEERIAVETGAWEIRASTPGVHTVDVAVVTPFGTGRRHPVRYSVG